MTRFAFQTRRNWTRYKVIDAGGEGFHWEHTADEILAELRDWWSNTDNPATSYWSPAMAFNHRRSVIVEISPGDMTCYRMMIVNVKPDQLPGKPWIAVALLNTYGSCVEFGQIELEKNGSPWAHDVGYVSSKLRIPEGTEACAAGPVVTQLLGLACRLIEAFP